MTRVMILRNTPTPCRLGTGSHVPPSKVSLILLINTLTQKVYSKYNHFYAPHHLGCRLSSHWLVQLQAWLTHCTQWFVTSCINNASLRALFAFEFEFVFESFGYSPMLIPLYPICGYSRISIHLYPKRWSKYYCLQFGCRWVLNLWHTVLVDTVELTSACIQKQAQT